MTQEIIAKLVRTGMTPVEAIEAVTDYTEADYIAEKEQEAREEAYWASVWEDDEWMYEAEGYSFDGEVWHCGTV